MSILNIRRATAMSFLMTGLCLALYYTMLHKRKDDVVIVSGNVVALMSETKNDSLSKPSKKWMQTTNKMLSVSPRQKHKKDSTLRVAPPTITNEYIIQSPLSKDRIIIEYVHTKRAANALDHWHILKPECPKKIKSVCISNNQGRLGNKMHQFSMLSGMAKHMGAIAELDERLYSYYAPFFNINITYFKRVNVSHQCTVKNAYTSVRDGHHSSFDRQAVNMITDPLKCHMRLGGFYQSWMYFNEYMDEIQSDLTFVPHIIAKAKEALVRLTKSFKKRGAMTYVGIHVRQGDITGLRLVGHGHITPPEHYFLQAMLYFTYRYNNVVFIVASDNKAWCNTTFTKIANKKHLSVAYSQEISPPADMALLLQCNHTIMTVGTFGIWVSMLTKGEVIYYPEASKPGSGYGSGFTRHKRDYYMPYWTTLF